MKLGTLLLRDAVITLAQLETALRTQVLYGGRLGTNLVELGYIDLDRLATYLGQVHGVPVATQARFEAAPRSVIDGFDGGLADLYTAFPLGPDPDAPDALAVAIADPSDTGSIEQLAAQCEQPLVAYVAPELRILYYLEKHFGLARKARYVRTGTRRSTAVGDNERRRAQAPGGMEMPPSVRFEPRRKTPTFPPEPAAVETTGRPPVPRVGYEDIARAIEAATTRNQIGDALIEYTVGRFEACVIFLLRDSNAIGWRFTSYRRSGSQEAVERLSLPLGGASVLQACHDSHLPFRGPAPSVGRPIERRLWETIGIGDAPEEMLVVPIMVRARVVNLVYVHGLEAGPIRDAHAAELIELCRHAADAYIRLIKSAKG